MRASNGVRGTGRVHARYANGVQTYCGSIAGHVLAETEREVDCKACLKSIAVLTPRAAQAQKEER